MFLLALLLLSLAGGVGSEPFGAREGTRSALHDGAALPVRCGARAEAPPKVCPRSVCGRLREGAWTLGDGSSWLVSNLDWHDSGHAGYKRRVMDLLSYHISLALGLEGRTPRAILLREGHVGAAQCPWT